jgi:hypothetical protein
LKVRKQKRRITMSRVKSFMLLEGGDDIVWERGGQTYEGKVECLQDDHHNGEAYVVSRMDGPVLKEHTVYPHEIRFYDMLKARRNTERMDTLIRGEDLND